jgi:hypothetical protein
VPDASFPRPPDRTRQLGGLGFLLAARLNLRPRPLSCRPVLILRRVVPQSLTTYELLADDCPKIVSFR